MRQRAGALVLAGVVLAVSACSVARKVYDPTRWVYEKKDATPARLDRDMTSCRRESIDLSKFAPTASQRIDREKFNRCMERHGYTVRTEREE
jgi:hypothetical protein